MGRGEHFGPNNSLGSSEVDREGFLCIAGFLAAFLASTHYVLVAHSASPKAKHENQEHL